jgi:flagellar biosynthesis/type III secretory pathway M-ring protein FliF/YscJ
MLAALVGLGGILWFAGQPSYVTVLEPASSEEMRTAKRVLSQAGVPTIPDETGRGLLVDRSHYGLARNALIEGGLLDKSQRSLLDSSLVEDADTKRFKLEAATRAQAEAAISALAGVQSATVTSSKPKRSVFRDRDRETAPQATVALRLRPEAAFDAVARSAASLASSQLGIPMTNVEVFDAQSPGQRWRYDPDREAGGGSAEFLALERRLAHERTAKAQDALDMIHPGKTKVTVGVELDPQWEITSQKVLAESPIVLSDSMTKDLTDNSERDTTPAGDPSVAAAQGSTESQARTSNSTKKETRDRTYMADIGERKSGKLAPEVKRLSVALIYDRALEQQPGFDKQNLVNVVKSIVGWDPARDQDTAFSSMVGEFSVEEPLAIEAGPGMGDLAKQWGPAIGQIVGVVLVILFLKSLLKTQPSREASAEPATASVSASSVDEAKLPPEEQQKRMRREIERAIASDPAALAKMMESWLTEQKV